MFNRNSTTTTPPLEKASDELKSQWGLKGSEQGTRAIEAARAGINRGKNGAGSPHKHPVAQMPEVKAVAEARRVVQRASQDMREFDPRALHGQYQSARERLAELEPLVEIGEASQKDVDALKAQMNEAEAALEAGSKRRRHAAAQQPILYRRYVSAVKAADAAIEKHTARDVKELRRAIEKVLEIGARIEEAEEAFHAASGARPYDPHILGSAATQALNVWLRHDGPHIPGRQYRANS